MKRNPGHQAALSASIVGDATGASPGDGRGTAVGQTASAGQFDENQRNARSERFRVGDE